MPTPDAAATNCDKGVGLSGPLEINAATLNATAGVYRGVRVTGSPGIRDDLVNAGALYEDAEVVVDGHHVSSRRPDDLPDFCRAVIALLAAE